MTRLSEYLLLTEKQLPADAEAISHKLMVRTGPIRQLGAGMWSWLPALGCPLRLTVGRRSLESGEIGVQKRRGREVAPPIALRSEPAALLAAVDELWQSLP